MFALSLQRGFSARHHLIGGDWGAENTEHAHSYRLELRLEGPSLDEHGYLVDLVEVERLLEAQVARVRGRSLNELPEFAGLNPSLEQFARILAGALAAELPPARLTALEVRMWESETAWASCRVEIP
jgi:6-pyruvoyltetrahydropterin/6-carboxytetrahydropterin synthase